MKDCREINWKIIEDEKDVLVVAQYPNKKFREIQFWRIKENEIKS